MQRLLFYDFCLIAFIPFHIVSEEPFDPENLSMYEYMDRYDAQSAFETVDSSCPGFVCEKSGLTEVGIVVLLNKENNIRNRFAVIEKLSNMYYVRWNADFARMARKKVMLCLPSTTIDQTIYDTKMLKELPYFRALNDSRSAKAVEVVIGLKAREIGNQMVQNIYSDMESEMSDFLNEDHFNHPDALLRRGNSVFMGCDYLIRNNDTHVLSNLVCIYGLLHFINLYHNAYKPQRGKTCSECAQFYDRYPALTTSVNHSSKWACDLLYPHLCTDIFNMNETAVPSNPYPCSGLPDAQTTSRVIFSFVTISPDADLGYTPMPDYKWPCYQVSVPIFLITLIVTIVIVYNIASILSFHSTLKPKTNE